MSLDCLCPDGVLNTVTNDNCKEYRGLGKGAKIFFQKVENTNAFVDGVNGIDLAASWATLPGAVDNTKVVVTPLLSTLAFEEVEVVDGVENFDGATTKSGVRPQRVVATITDPKPEHVAALDSIACNTNVGVYFVTSNDKILGNETTDTPQTFLPIKISQETYIGKTPTRTEEFGAQFIYQIEFQIPADWYSTSQVAEPESGFSYLTDVVAP
jgi:hypothetical protein